MESPEPTRVVTLRLPARLHARLKRAAKVSGSSINLICVTGAERELEVVEEYHGLNADCFGNSPAE